MPRFAGIAFSTSSPLSPSTLLLSYEVIKVAHRPQTQGFDRDDQGSSTPKPQGKRTARHIEEWVFSGRQEFLGRPWKESAVIY